MSLVGVVLAPAAGTEAAVLDASWTAPVTNADGTPLTDLAGYRVYLGTSTPTCPSSSFYSVTSPTSAPSANQTVRTTITGLAAGTTYSMRVSAVDQSGQQSGCTAAVSGIARAALSVSPSGIVSFGSALTGVSIDRTFTVQNMTGSTLTGGSSVAAPFTIVTGGSFSLAAGASQAVVVRFRPTVAGTFAANVNFTAQGDTISRGVSGSATGSGPSLPAVSIGNATVREGNTGTVNAVFTVKLSAASSQTVTVRYATANGTAAAGSDYTATSGTLTFTPGQVTRTIAVVVRGDTAAGPSETFVVNLSNPTNAIIGDGQGVGTITDDD
jgi:hypothetical protein